MNDTDCNCSLPARQGTDDEVDKKPNFNPCPRWTCREFEDRLHRFKRLCDASFEGIVIHENGIYIESNQQFAEMFGYDIQEIQGLDGYNLFAPDSRQVAGEKITSGYEGVYQAIGLKKDGTEFPVEVRAKESYLNGRKVRIAVCRDMTLQKAMEREILEREKKYRELYEYAQIPLFRARLSDSKLLEYNRAMVNLLGGQVNQQNLQDDRATHYINPVQWSELLKRLKTETRVGRFEVEFLCRNGLQRWGEITATYYPEKGYLEGLIIDITAMKVLTPTEKRILTLLVQGKTNKQIARQMERSVRTIEDHRGHIMQKLGIENLVELGKYSQFMAWELEK